MFTANNLSLRDPCVAESQDVNWVMAVAALASSHNVQALDPIAKVTILILKKFPKAREFLRQGWKTDKFIPFDPVSKRITTVCRLGKDWYVCPKGAPREDTAQTIVEAQALDVPVKMLTGDAIAISKETFKMVGLGANVYNSTKLV